ncbi:MAG: anthranilate phosphoribosyltransferase [Pseudomonadota bacterium]
MDIQKALASVADGENLGFDAMAAVMRVIMSGDATDAQIGGLLMALRIKGETIEEIAGAASIMRELATPVRLNVTDPVDLVGTGGDGANLFNVSTAACFVVAAAGVPVAKHGNRSVSSTSGSSDVLESLGVPLDLDADQVGTLVDTVGIGFMFAPSHHSAMRYAVGPRRELGLRTLFNVLGPLTNPAGVERQVLGVFEADLCVPMAQALKTLGSVHAMVVHSDDGLDELSVAAPSIVAELRDDQVQSFVLDPRDYDLHADDLSGLTVDSAAASASIIRAALGDESSDPSAGESYDVDKARKIIALNAGATIYVAGRASTLADGMAQARALLENGSAASKLDEFVAATKRARGAKES